MSLVDQLPIVPVPSCIDLQRVTQAASDLARRPVRTAHAIPLISLQAELFSNCAPNRHKLTPSQKR